MTLRDIVHTDNARLINGHVLDALQSLPDQSVHCVVTSPPYWGLRAYGTDPQVWGGYPPHEHVWDMFVRRQQTGGTGEASTKQVTNTGSQESQQPITSGGCACGAWLGELGSEPLISMFVEHLVSIFREVRRVTRDDATLWVNLGDSYAGSGRGPTGHNGIGNQEQRQGFIGGAGDPHGTRSSKTAAVGGGSVKAKNLCLIPERFALAMQDAGWYVRSRIAWCKVAPMPESVTDRPSSAWEHVWLFTKSPRYFWNQDAAREPAIHAGKIVTLGEKSLSKGSANGLGIAASGNGKADSVTVATTRNMWNWWLLGPDPSHEAHFATFPRDLVRNCIKAGCPDDGVVLDPFMGSGRTGEVALSMGRAVIGIELNPAYCEIAAKKMRQLVLL